MKKTDFTTPSQVKESEVSDLLVVKDVVNHLDLSTGTVYKMIAEGLIPVREVKLNKHRPDAKETHRLFIEVATLNTLDELIATHIASFRRYAPRRLKGMLSGYYQREQ